MAELPHLLHCMLAYYVYYFLVSCYDTLKNRQSIYWIQHPPYSPELNPAEILWRILKGNWIRPVDYETTDSLFYCTNMALASVGTNLFVNYSYL